MNEKILDNRLVEAIRKSVELHNQPPEVTARLIAFLQEVLSGNNDLFSDDFAFGRLDLLFDTIVSEEPKE